jgi:hypothetical protein
MALDIAEKEDVNRLDLWHRSRGYWLRGAPKKLGELLLVGTKEMAAGKIA